LPQFLEPRKTPKRHEKVIKGIEKKKKKKGQQLKEVGKEQGENKTIKYQKDSCRSQLGGKEKRKLLKKIT